MRSFWADWDGGVRLQAKRHPFSNVKAVASLAIASLTHSAAAPLGIALVFGLTFAGMRKTATVLILLAVFASAWKKRPYCIMRHPSYPR